MKILKYAITVIVVILCFLLSSELYQSKLQTFTHRFYFVDIENEDRELICSLVTSAAEEQNETVFAVERKDIDSFQSQLTIYVTSESAKKVFLQQGIEEGSARSFFSGSTEVVFSPFQEIVQNRSIVRYYFTGTKEAVGSIRQYINSEVATSYIHKERVSGVENLIYSIWILSLGFLLLLTWFDIQFSRKHDFLKISMGCSVWRIIWRNILVDSILTVVTTSIVYVFLREKIFIDYRIDFVFLALTVFVLLNALLYISLNKYDYKEIIYGANINGKLLANTYLLKALVMIMLVISLSFNLMVIGENIDVLRPFDKLDGLDGYSTLVITPTEETIRDEESTNNLRSRAFLEGYIQDKVLLSTSCAALDEPIIVLNGVAKDAVVSTPDLFNNIFADFVVYVPYEKAGVVDDYDIEFAVSTTARNFFGMEEYSFEITNYTHTEVVYFDLRKVSELQFGFEMISDPVIVYCNISSPQIKELMDEKTCVEFGDRWANIIFKDTTVFSEEVGKTVQSISFNSVAEQCSQHQNSLIRTILINSILSVFLLALSVLLISVIVRIEYLINSKEIALKKILGYSIVHRNIAIIALNVFAVLIAVITGIILSKMYDVFSLSILYVVGSSVLVLDTILILSNMTSEEKKNTAHILKGGSL